MFHLLVSWLRHSSPQSNFLMSTFYIYSCCTRVSSNMTRYLYFTLYTLIHISTEYFQFLLIALFFNLIFWGNTLNPILNCGLNHINLILSVSFIYIYLSFGWSFFMMMNNIFLPEKFISFLPCMRKGCGCDFSGKNDSLFWLSLFH